MGFPEFSSTHTTSQVVTQNTRDASEAKQFARATGAAFGDLMKRGGDGERNVTTTTETTVTTVTKHGDGPNVVETKKTIEKTTTQ